MNFPSTVSCTIRKIFNLRQKVQIWITTVVGNGLDTFLWYHNWHPFGPLKDWFGDRLDHNLLRSQNSVVASTTSDNTWHWDRPRTLIVREILAHIPPNLQPHWFQDSISWHKVVWFSKAVPRWSVIEWLAILARLSTKDRLQVWGTVDNADGVLCSGGLETHSHLFFLCPFSSQVWRDILRMNNLTKIPGTLLQELDWFRHNMKGEGFFTVFMQIIPSCYHLPPMEEEECTNFSTQNDGCR
ncbi:uncharacterized protein LOC131314090 [Rhododendron vialii]|uniref:uncharacterized protein LOC131314090 n=1 Tax=Rhododendron vialii TaxID=182163 RepID=UPI00265FA31D|nr:uncharacterized protein LOC131314090 [Rhododendron vialii]